MCQLSTCTASAQVWPEGRTGVEVRVEGFSHKLGLLTRTIFQRLATLHTQVPALALPGVCHLAAVGRIATFSACCTAQ